MSTLTLLSDIEVTNYIATLNVAEGSETYRILNSMLLLPPACFSKVISAIAQNLISFSNIRTLPAMNERLVDAMIYDRLGSEDEQTIKWKYKQEWLPASIDFIEFKKNCLGSSVYAVASKFTDYWGMTVSPTYDLFKIDETKFFTYVEAYVAYMVIAKQNSYLIDNFLLVHQDYKSRYPELFLVNDEDSDILKLIQSLVEIPYFLEQSNGHRIQNILLEWILSKSWRYILHSNFFRFLDEIAYPTMAETSDPLRTGVAGCRRLLATVAWKPLSVNDPGWEFDVCRLARYYLPNAYGERILLREELDVEKERELAMIQYLTEVNTVIRKMQENISVGMSTCNALDYRTISGSVMGLLISVTTP
jgi:hypothetical protein